MSLVPARLSRLRERIRALGFSHYLVPSSDEHLNEYLPERNLRRQWMSGFTGSAGDLLVGPPDETLLFTDGRYHEQAETQLGGSGITLMRVGRPDVPGLIRYVGMLGKRLGPALRLGVDPFVTSMAMARALRAAITPHGGTLEIGAANVVDEYWNDRPAPARDRLEALDVAACGASPAAKLAKLRAALAAGGADAFVAVKLDQIAWLLNLRSTVDVPFNPVFLAYLFVDADRVVLHVEGGAARVPGGALADVKGLEVRNYGAFAETLGTVADRVVSIDPDRVTEAVGALLASRNRLIEQPSPIETEKARKNEVEIEQMKAANLLASVAKTRSILWATSHRQGGAQLTEASFKEHIEARYAELPGYRGLSFNTISATGDHAALPHYSGADGSVLEDGHTFVIDSGIQIGAGTTDDTRTLGIGAATREQREIFTLVLKAHIQGAAALFPAGTVGASIDALVRNPLWARGLDYAHGTGHGVGALLNVHEGPFQIGDLARRPTTTLPLEPGMITSIEPGYYRKGFGGVRHENLYLVVDHATDDFGRKWLGFEPLTFVPFDLAWIDRSALDARECAWLDDYHVRCRAALAPHLAPAERAALDAYLSRSA